MKFYGIFHLFFFVLFLCFHSNMIVGKLDIFLQNFEGVCFVCSDCVHCVIASSKVCRLKVCTGRKDLGSMCSTLSRIGISTSSKLGFFFLVSSCTGVSLYGGS